MNIQELQQRHDLENEMYTMAKAKLFTEGGGAKAEWKQLANQRLDKLVEMLKSVEISGSYVTAIDLFVSFFDDVIVECSVCTSRRADIEKKIIALCKKALKNQPLRNVTDEHVTAVFIDSANAEASADSSKKMAQMLLDNTNPLRLGLTIYKSFCKKNPDFADKDALAYLEAEEAVRKCLIMGDDTKVVPHMEKMLQSPFDCPEKYLLVALNFFYVGLSADALNSIDIGLTKFPANERLQSARGAIAG